MLDLMTAASDEKENRLAWTKPGAFEEAPGVFRIPAPDARRRAHRPSTSTPSRTARGSRSIDRRLVGGAGASRSRARAQAAGHDRRRRSPRILVTHAHRDHYTLAVALRREFGMPIAIGVGEKVSVEGVRKGGKAVRAAARSLARGGRRGAGARHRERRWPLRSPPPTGRCPTNGSPRAPSTSALACSASSPHRGTPAGHVVFVDDENELLLAGDHVLPHITPSIGFEPFPVESPLREFLDSLEKIRGMEDLRLLPAHGSADGEHACTGGRAGGASRGALQRDTRDVRTGASRRCRQQRRVEARGSTWPPRSAGRGGARPSSTWTS